MDTNHHTQILTPFLQNISPQNHNQVIHLLAAYGLQQLLTHIPIQNINEHTIPHYITYKNLKQNKQFTSLQQSVNNITNKINTIDQAIQSTLQNNRSHSANTALSKRMCIFIT